MRATVEVLIAIRVACRIPPGIPVAGEPEFGEFIDDRAFAGGRYAIELITEAEAVVEHAHREVEGLGEHRVFAREGHAQLGMPVRG